MIISLSCLEKKLLHQRKIVPSFRYQFDSRAVGSKDIFFALKGDRVDGHDFLKEVAQRGAFGAVVKSTYAKADFGLELYRVDNVLDVLQHLAKRALERKKGRVVAITGSVGKTTTKEFINTLLEKKFSVSRNLRSFNSQRGLPLSILNMADEQDVILLEMGMSLKKEMERLANIVKPEIALFTPIGLVHAGNFSGVEEIAKEKSMIISKERTKIIIAPYDLLQFKDIFKKEEMITYSLKKSCPADYNLFLSGNKIYIKGKNEGVFPKIFGEYHLLQNFLAAFVLAKELGMENEEIEERLSFLSTVPLRFEKICKRGVLFIQDCYNANSLSTIAALENLPKVLGKKIAVLGEMGDLGKFSKSSHEKVGEVAAKNIDILLAIGLESQHMIEAFRKSKTKGKGSFYLKNYFYFDNFPDLIQKLKEIIGPKDLVLIKGSRPLEMERILGSKEFD